MSIYLNNELFRNYDNCSIAYMMSDRVIYMMNIKSLIMLIYSFWFIRASFSIILHNLMKMFIDMKIETHFCMSWCNRSCWIYYSWWILIDSSLSYSIFMSRNFLMMSRFFISNCSISNCLILMISFSFSLMIIKLLI